MITAPRSGHAWSICFNAGERGDLMGLLIDLGLAERPPIDPKAAANMLPFVGPPIFRLAQWQ